jgi:hypothetical protein
MNLQDQMAADLAAVFLRVDEFASPGTYRPLDAAGSFSLVVVPGDDSPSTRQGDGGQSQSGRILATTTWAAFRDGMATVDLAGADPSHGDQFTFTAPGPLAGDWRLDTWATDNGGALVLGLVRSEWFSVGANGVRGGA